MDLQTQLGLTNEEYRLYLNNEAEANQSTPGADTDLEQAIQESQKTEKAAQQEEANIKFLMTEHRFTADERAFYAILRDENHNREEAFNAVLNLRNSSSVKPKPPARTRNLQGANAIYKQQGAYVGNPEEQEKLENDTNKAANILSRVANKKW